MTKIKVNMTVHRSSILSYLALDSYLIASLRGFATIVEVFLHKKLASSADSSDTQSERVCEYVCPLHKFELEHTG
jgi:hypothetical protein